MLSYDDQRQTMAQWIALAERDAQIWCPHVVYRSRRGTVGVCSTAYWDEAALEAKGWTLLHRTDQAVLDLRKALAEARAAAG